MGFDLHGRPPFVPLPLLDLVDWPPCSLELDLHHLWSPLYISFKVDQQPLKVPLFRDLSLVPYTFTMSTKFLSTCITLKSIIRKQSSESYLIGTVTHGLLIKQLSSSSSIGFSKADWDSNLDDCKSTTSFYIYLGCNIVWISSLLQELCIVSVVSTIYSDNLDSVHLVVNPVMQSKFQHFELDLLFVHNWMQQRLAHLVHIPRRFQLIDILTKPLSSSMFLKFMVIPNFNISS